MDQTNIGVKTPSLEVFRRLRQLQAMHNDPLVLEALAQLDTSKRVLTADMTYEDKVRFVAKKHDIEPEYVSLLEDEADNTEAEATAD